MSEQKQILSIIDNLGGRENIKNYYHCATRLRFNLFDYDKIKKDALKANPLILSVVQASGQCQLIIGNKVGAVYSALHGVLETDGQNSTPSSSGTATNRESFISRIFAFISGSFLPLIGILAASGLLRAFTTLLLSLPSLAGNYRFRHRFPASRRSLLPVQWWICLAAHHSSANARLLTAVLSG